MAKRSAEAADGEDGDLAYLKRQRISAPTKIPSPAEEVRSAKQLQQILAFDQDTGRLRQGGYSALPLPEFTNGLSSHSLLQVLLRQLFNRKRQCGKDLYA